MKKLLCVSLVMLLSISLLAGCGKKKDKAPEPTPEENKKPGEIVNVNTNEDVIKDQVIGTLTFSNTSLVYDNGTTTFQTSVTNNGTEAVDLSNFKIHIMNGEEEVAVLRGWIADPIEPGKTKISTNTYAGNISNATAINYEL